MTRPSLADLLHGSDGTGGIAGATLERRFRARLRPEGDCLLWTGAVRNGYGAIGVYWDRQTVVLDTHRLAYELVNGPIPDGLWIDHLCRNKPCCNADHLEAPLFGEGGPP